MNNEEVTIEQTFGSQGFLRTLNGIALAAMTLILGCLGVQELALGHVPFAMMLQVPLYGVGVLAWGVASGAPWVRNLYMIGYCGAGVFTMALYIWLAGPVLKEQLETWALSFSTGDVAQWVLGIPAAFWLILGFVGVPAITWWVRERREEYGKSLGEFLLG